MQNYNRETEIKNSLAKILNLLSDLDIQNINITRLLSIKNALSSVNNLITLLATYRFVDFLTTRNFICTNQAELIKKSIQNQHANANGYDIDYTHDNTPIIAEIKCNIPVKNNEFGSAQRNGIIKDIKGLISGKKRIYPKKAYKFMVILNSDLAAPNIDTRSAIDKILPQIKAEGHNVNYLPDDISTLKSDTVYIVILDIDTICPAS